MNSLLVLAVVGVVMALVGILLVEKADEEKIVLRFGLAITVLGTVMASVALSQWLVG